ncbi:hypothetical protein CLOSPI_01455 [Thomasclavelia spiroformis DSM 1552]|uniref:Uncharacterized protein n=1 Tax=Thomasclavelia spiroformis DSM 1552 TaxID=428126 RepID=B1C2J3_9FIRM|nr:hypothetical protein CLOSPI_01455 [Thomasclavelia spiroformis DSM 1552]
MINLFKSLQSILIMQKHEEYDRVNLANKQNKHCIYTIDMII